VRVHDLIEMEGFVAHPQALEMLAKRAESILTAFHNENPLLSGMDSAELLRQLRVTEPVTLSALANASVIELGRTVNLPGQGTRFSKAQTKAVESLLVAFDRDPYAPPSYKDASKSVGEGVVKALLAQGELVFFRPDVLMRPDAYRAMTAYTRQKLEAGEVVSVASLRDHFATSRRIALPFLDMLEGQGITKRSEDGHVLFKARWDAL
jgi:selenocysteine-specific elongation factor